MKFACEMLFKSCRQIFFVLRRLFSQFYPPITGFSSVLQFSFQIRDKSRDARCWDANLPRHIIKLPCKSCLWKSSSQYLCNKVNFYYSQPHYPLLLSRTWNPTSNKVQNLFSRLIAHLRARIHRLQKLIEINPSDCSGRKRLKEAKLKWTLRLVLR